MFDSEPVFGNKLGDLGMVIGYQVDEFTAHLVSRSLYCSVIHLAWFHRQHINIKLGMRITPFWTRLLKTLGMVLILSSQALLTHKNWMHPLMRLIPCLPHSLWVFYACYYSF